MDTSRNYDSAQCYVNWEIDGRAALNSDDGRVGGRTRRIHLIWDDESLKDSYLVFVAPERYRRPNSDARRVWGNEALFLGRNIDIEMGNQALIKSWLDLCRKTHQGPCRDDTLMERSAEFGDIISQSYFGVIDVLDMQLTSLPFETYTNYSDMTVTERKHERETYYHDHERGRGPQIRRSQPYNKRVKHAPYVALSYVWGKREPYMTKLSNVMLHRAHGGLERNFEELPRVFHDAFNLVRCLGVRHLWIDSLCIVQDSSRSWGLNSRAMDLIYGNAVLTICAADGVDSSTGLRAMHPKEHDAHQISADCAPGVRLMVSRPPEIGIKASTWNTRAWTFQERLLSKRCLIFTEGRVYFQCLSTGMSEDIFADREGAGWSLDLVNAPLQMLRELSRRALWVYTNCVPLYTARILTNRRDILAAFNGICNLMEKTMHAPFVFGLPSSHFDMALLWQSQSALERRAPKNTKERVEYNGMQFPSWSWCGWTSDALDSPMENKAEYKSAMVDGCLPNVQEWLMKHTWIHWYIRDGHGNLRPLWHERESIEDESSEKRWKGYRTRLDHVVVNGHVRGRRRQHWRGESGERRRGDSGEWRRGDSGERRRGDSGESLRGRREGSPNEYEDRERSLVHVVGVEADSLFDDYGRTLPESIVDKKRKEFCLTLPENPYRVVMADYDSKPDKEFPDQPILQFWTWYTSLNLVASENPGPKPGKGLSRYDIADEIGDWCGSLVLDDQWIAKSRRSKQNFIAISEAKAFAKEECDVWTYYIPKEREQSEWDLYYVLLIERKENTRWERVALGKVFKAAFADAEWKEIILG